MENTGWRDWGEKKKREETGGGGKQEEKGHSLCFFRASAQPPSGRSLQFRRSAILPARSTIQKGNTQTAVCLTTPDCVTHKACLRLAVLNITMMGIVSQNLADRIKTSFKWLDDCFESYLYSLLRIRRVESGH